MNIYIFESVEKVSDNYHEGGGLAIVAEDIEQLKQLVAGSKFITLTGEELSSAIVYPLKGKHAAKIYTFPNAGCC